MQSMVPLGTQAPTNQITPIVPGEANDPTRAQSRGRLWRLDERAVDVLWIGTVSARFEKVSRRIRRKEFVNLASRILCESKILCAFFRGRRRNERDGMTSVYKTDGSFEYLRVLSIWKEVSQEISRRTPKMSTLYPIGGGRARGRIVSSVA